MALGSGVPMTLSWLCGPSILPGSYSQTCSRSRRRTVVNPLTQNQQVIVITSSSSLELQLAMVDQREGRGTRKAENRVMIQLTRRGKN